MLAAFFVLRFFVVWLGVLPYIFFIIFCVLMFVDYYFLYSRAKGIFSTRFIAERLSNGDENPVMISIENRYATKVYLEVIDEIPHQFQRRDILFTLDMQPGQTKNIRYSIFCTVIATMQAVGLP